MSETAAGPRCTCNDSSTVVPWCPIHPGTTPVAVVEAYLRITEPEGERMFDLSKSHNVRPDWAATLTIYERKEGER